MIPRRHGKTRHSRHRRLGSAWTPERARHEDRLARDLLPDVTYILWGPR
jgi:hypothetical protein